MALNKERAETYKLKGDLIIRTMFESNERGYILLRRGKVRYIYTVGNSVLLMIIATDRISAFDCVLPIPIPEKGIILTQLSNFWFRKTEHIIQNHVVNPDPKELDWYYDDDWYYDEIRGRIVLVRKAEPLPVEAIVRGFLAGSAWNEYRDTGTVSGIRLPKGLCQSEKLPEPVYTPSTKAEAGKHDENITFKDSINILGSYFTRKIKDVSLKLYRFAEMYARDRGIIIADTKFEFVLSTMKLS